MIDEKKLIEALEEKAFEANLVVGEHSAFLKVIGFGNVKRIIEKQPKVGEWIPCSERHPNKEEYLKNDGRFIVTDGNRVYQSIYDIYSAHCFRTLRLFKFGSESKFEVDNCVIAWMPLPEPYKPEESEQPKPPWADAVLRTFLGRDT